MTPETSPTPSIEGPKFDLFVSPKKLESSKYVFNRMQVGFAAYCFGSGDFQAILPRTSTTMFPAKL